MRVYAARCANCRLSFEASLKDARMLVFCPGCGARQDLWLFPALARPAPARPDAGAVVLTDESTCFHHSEKRAEAVCDACGCFLCALCDIEAPGGGHYCPACHAKGEAGLAKVRERSGQMLYDEVALTMALISTLIPYFSPFTAPVVLYIVFKYWSKPLSAVPRGRWRFVVALLLAMLQLVGILFLIGLLWYLYVVEGGLPT
ncbi:MAG: hypothetical protein GXY15_02530 [Candidatus Hydrogenedentes bacterium]|nr:hypothetical protein [Candidatus Hydrogenedentota bacterium]